MSDFDMPSSRREPRLVSVSRRRFLGSVAAGGAFISIPGLACGTSDEEVFAQATSSAAPTTSVGPTSTAAPASDEAATTAEPSTTTTEPSTTSEAPTALAAAEMLVSFTYTPDGTGKQENPYVAVWVETPEGELVDTVALWFEQSQKGDRWINDLRRWYDTSNRAADVTMSAATRSAGSYTVAWDLTDLGGAAVSAGDYVLFVESARERGPHHITSVPISLATAQTAVLADDGELHDLSVMWA